MNRFFLHTFLLVILSCLAISPLSALESSLEFSQKQFSTCDELDNTIIHLVQKSKNDYWYPYMYARGAVDTMILDKAVPTAANAQKSVSVTESIPTLYSKTNIQVAWVDEGDQVKTDGKYIYTYSDTNSEVRIVRADTLSIEHTIKLPTSLSQPELYLISGKLTIIGSQYLASDTTAMYRWYLPDNKTTVLIYDVKDPKNTRYDWSYQIDGNYRESRMIGDRLYFLSDNTLRLPPWYLSEYGNRENGFELTLSGIARDFTLENWSPKIRESSPSNITKNGFIESVRSSVVKCSQVKLLIPSDNVLNRINFIPSFVSLSSLDVTKPTAPMKSTLIFWNASQIHMSTKSLYILSSLSVNDKNTDPTQTTLCPPNAKCTSILPIQSSQAVTLIHRYSLRDGNPEYTYTTSVPGNPLSQYSLDEDALGNFRLVTSEYSWQNTTWVNSTRVSVVNPSGKVIGTLSGIAPKENFQSARFIGNRLYLVTFEQIDPLFVIDLSIPTTPKILGELKIPGYSTYLHPYDEKRLIGIGYDTVTNQWWWTQNGWVKIDLYNVSDVKNPQRESTLTIGTAGSIADVLSNPRLFTWYKEKNLLFLPATIISGYQDSSKQTIHTSWFQWLLWVSITPQGISEKFRVTHINRDATLASDWKKSCDDVFKTLKQPVCRKLLNGTSYCESNYQYVPQYCYAGATVDSYFAENMWNYSTSFIERAVYIGENYYTLSDARISAWKISRPTSSVGTRLFMDSLKPVLPIPLWVLK
jgi:inhibitor of cysteine peptidase